VIHLPEPSSGNVNHIATPAHITIPRIKQWQVVDLLCSSEMINAIDSARQDLGHQGQK